MARKLLNLPPELLIKSLEDLSVEDVVCVAQTCALLRTLVSSNKTVFLNTNDRDNILALPFGRPLTSLSSKTLHERAVQALKSVERQNASPLSHLPFSALNLVYNYSDPPSDFFVHGNVLAFRAQKRMYVILIGSTGVIMKAVQFVRTLSRIE
ncbi:hypothetical protein SISSUDRAFT_1032049 [Sistotremastrum suecicum HHB10207 ss-3]|uniref:F-box domain-containing protein n=1 Tax=Sistotremastrum suecicum HHB10207 ss-3 TaxID=1314776 RepID=A0A166F2U7_9AGAM|nr:hypothetical protein SISSUDRAFT_1032049 [Sistotremastrum suecicum HHB10207 ss-3]